MTSRGSGPTTLARHLYISQAAQLGYKEIPRKPNTCALSFVYQESTTYCKLALMKLALMKPANHPPLYTTRPDVLVHPCVTPKQGACMQHEEARTA